MAKQKKEIQNIFKYNITEGTYIIGDPCLIFENFNIKDIPKSKKILQGYNDKQNFYFIKSSLKECKGYIDYIECNTEYKNTINTFIIKRLKDEKLLRNKSCHLGITDFINYKKIKIKTNAILTLEICNEGNFIYINEEGEPGPTVMLTEF